MRNILSHIVAVARGRRRADLVLKGGLLLNVFSGELERSDVAVANGIIAGIGEYEGTRVIDASRGIVLPGFIDSHVHIESSMLTPAEFCRTVLPRGTTAVVADPHEIANVLGKRGIRYMLDATEGLPLSFYFMLPSCVPASDFETSGARLDARDLRPFLKHERVLGLAEVMDYPGVLAGSRRTIRKVRAFRDGPIDGHAPGLSGKDLCAYRAAGMTTDHEASTAAEAAEKAARGITVFIRESSAARNLSALLPAVTGANSTFFCFATDDRNARDLLSGGIDSMIGRAIRLGLDPVTAVRMATINPARHFNMRTRGAIAPGYEADLVVIDNFRDFRVDRVLVRGTTVARGGRPVFASRAVRTDRRLTDTIRAAPVSARRLQFPCAAGHARAVELVPGSIETRGITVPVIAGNGRIANGIERDLAKLVVVERHRKTGRTGLGLVRGFGLKAGAFASTVAHDSHNMIAAGASDGDIAAALRGLIRMRGGMIVVKKGRVLARLPLPVAGLMSGRGAERVAEAQARLDGALKTLGVRIDSAFAALSFLALSVVPDLKLTDRGLVDVNRSRLVPLFREPCREPAGRKGRS